MRDPFRFRQLAAVGAVIATLVLAATPGRADVLPSKRETEKPCTAPGQFCTTDDELEGKPGTCVAATCSKVMQKHTREGGTAEVKFPCFHCVAGGPGSSKANAKSSGCTVAPERGETGSLAVVALLIAGLVRGRARRRYGGR